MAVCILLTTLTDEGRKTIREYPEKLKNFKKEIEDAGIDVKAQYVLVGQYDLLEIFEGENKETICKVALDGGNRGVSQTIALMGMSIDEFITAVKK